MDSAFQIRLEHISNTFTEKSLHTLLLVEFKNWADEIQKLGRRNQRENFFIIGVSPTKLKQVHMAIFSHHSPQHESLDVSEPNYCDF